MSGRVLLWGCAQLKSGAGCGLWLATLAAILLTGAAVAAQMPAHLHPKKNQLPIIQIHDNRTPAGKLEDGVLRVRLEIREGRWFPESEPGPSLGLQAFAEEGSPAQIPGPLLRVPQGTEIRATVRNRLGVAAKVYGLHDHPGGAQEPLEIPPGEVREMRFRADVPGTYYYWGDTTGRSFLDRWTEDSQLSGALVVDPPGGSPPDRVFVIGLWGDDEVKGDPNRPLQETITINGKAWPHSERLTYTVGETVRWRWINTSVADHPMHLHGFYFQVESVGDGTRDENFPPERRRRVVTERMSEGGTMSLTWKPERDGRWLFHCHIAHHMSPEVKIFDPTYSPAAGAAHHHGDDGTGMAGLVMGIEVMPASVAVDKPAGEKPIRELRLLVRERPATPSSPQGYAYQWQQGEQEPPLEEATIPGAPLVLTRDEPVAITIVNQTQEPTSVHWHGIELESYYDGVPGWTGRGPQVTPAIAPGETFVARMAPPKAGTFIYHTHWHDLVQLTGGLYGPLVVLEPGEKFDAESDRIFLISIGGPDDSKDPILVNGSAQPEPVRLKAGARYRFRFINITANNAGLRVSLLAEGKPARWRPLAKDGAEVPAAQGAERDARQVVSVGETYDFFFEPSAPGELRLEVLRPATGSLVAARVLVE